MLVFSFVGILFGSLIYKGVAQCLDIRAMVVLACVVNTLGSLGQMFFARGFYFGMSAFTYEAIVMLCSEAVYFAFEVMSAMTLLAKIIPPRVESSMFAMLAGFLALSYWFLARMIGNLVNVFFGVTSESHDDLWKLYIVQSVVALVPILFVWLLPVREQVRRIQGEIAAAEEAEKAAKLDEGNAEVGEGAEKEPEGEEKEEESGEKGKGE